MDHTMTTKRLLSIPLVTVVNIYITPQAPDRFNPKVTVNTCGIIQKLYETKHIETMTFVKSVIHGPFFKDRA